MYLRIALYAALLAVAASAIASELKPTPEEWLAVEKQTITDAETTIRVSMKDPDATQFNDVQLHWYPVDDTRGGKTQITAVCGMVNGKNSYGGYVGFRRFINAIIEDADSGPEALATFEDHWQERCVHGTPHHSF